MSWRAVRLRCWRLAARAPGHRGRMPTLVDPYRDHLRARRAEDPAVPVWRLLAEIRELGYTGSMNLLYRYITQGRVEADRPHLSPRRVTRSCSPGPTPSVTPSGHCSAN